MEYSIPERLEKGCYDRRFLMPIWYVKPMDIWEYKETWEHKFKVGTKRNYYNVPILISSFPGKPIHSNLKK